MRRFATLALAMLAVAGAWAGTAHKETKVEKDARMEWWREARFGMFLHWGLYSVPAGEYNGKTGYGEWLREEAHVPVGTYEKFKDQFNPVNFKADSFVKMAKDAGMKYIVITTKHHDGFNLWDSPFTDWDVMSTPFHRDIMAEMAAACKKYGMKMCWYHSIMDWHHPDYLPRRSWEGAQRPVDGADMDRYVEYLRNEVKYLLTHYGPIGVMWFDGEWESTWNAKYGKALYELCRATQPGVIVNNRVSVSRGGAMGSDGNDQEVGDFSTPEQTIPATGLGNVDWETCMTMNDHWGYNSHDNNWKSSAVLIHNIVDVASKGGNYLLNIGPRADGTFPPESVVRLKDIGAFMHTSGQGIYGTTASVFENLSWGRSTTRREGDKTVLYLHVLDWPKDGRLVIPGLANKPLDAKLLGGHLDHSAVRDGGDLVIQLPANAPNPYCSTVALTVEGAPIVYKAPKISTTGDILVTTSMATIAVPLGLEVRYTLDGSEPTGSSPLATSPVVIDRTGTLKAASFRDGKRVSAVVEQKFEKVTPWPSQGSQEGHLGLLCEEYAGSWDVLPDFSKLTAKRSFNATEVAAPTTEYVGRRYTGYLMVPGDDAYAFSLMSDDGSRLWIDGKLVVDNDGLHSAQTKVGYAPLAKGAHKITIEWFNGTGGYDLKLDWGVTGHPLKTIGGTDILSNHS